AMTFMLLLLLRARRHSPWWSVLIAWNPLVTLEIGGMGHQDIVGVLLVLIGLYAMAKRGAALSTASMAFGAAVKPFALFVAPFALRDLPEKRIRGVVLFAAALIVLYLPPLIIQRGYAGWRETAQTYSRSWEANGSFYQLILRRCAEREEGRAAELAKQMPSLLAAAALLATALLAWQVRAAPATGGYWLCLV